jgi:hypothetical protein
VGGGNSKEQTFNEFSRLVLDRNVLERTSRRWQRPLLRYRGQSPAQVQRARERRARAKEREREREREREAAREDESEGRTGGR